MVGLKNRIVLKTFEHGVDKVAYDNLLGLGSYLKGERIQWEFTSETFCAVITVLGIGHSGVRTPYPGFTRTHFVDNIDHGGGFAGCTVFRSRVVGFIVRRYRFTTLTSWVYNIDHFSGFTFDTTNCVCFPGNIIVGSRLSTLTQPVLVFDIYHSGGFTFITTYQCSFTRQIEGW
jgi:hypothetical protein